MGVPVILKYSFYCWLILVTGFYGAAVSSHQGSKNNATADSPSEYQKLTAGTRLYQSADSGLLFKLLVEAENLGGAEVEIAEITLNNYNNLFFNKD